jgi:predicted anti-sigma-YlaC factor YlaD
MYEPHLAGHIAALVDGQLAPPEAARANAHLADCSKCRAVLDRYQFAANMMRAMPLVAAPDAIWTSIELSLSKMPHATAGLKSRPTLRWSLVLPLAAAVILAVFATVFWQIDREPAPWDVVRLEAPTGEGPMVIGEWIETDAASSARIKIGEIGTVDIAPNTRMQLLGAKPDEHRLSLARGLISAQILAPPRLFFVETPSSTVVDLGCAYTMEVDEAGNGYLRVTSGWASLEWDTLESLVPAGASAPARAELGPGTPAFDDAPERFRQALLDFDYGDGGNGAVDVVLAEARQRDTLTLWHLLSRVDPSQRVPVFDRMVALTPLPSGVTRDKALALDPATLQLWREELAWTW